MIFNPGGGGFIAVSNPKDYGLVGGYPIDEDDDNGIGREGYGISMFHQIHCLASHQLASSWANIAD